MCQLTSLSWPPWNPFYKVQKVLDSLGCIHPGSLSCFFPHVGFGIKLGEGNAVTGPILVSICKINGTLLFQVSVGTTGQHHMSLYVALTLKRSAAVTPLLSARQHSARGHSGGGCLELSGSTALYFPGPCSALGTRK